jgi:nucleotide sugar dehydrogenase
VTTGTSRGTGTSRRIVSAPTVSFSALGGTRLVPAAPCEHAPKRRVSPWTGEPDTCGTVAVVGAGKMGLTLAGQFASHGWSVVAVDVQPEVVASVNAGRSHIGEPELEPILATAHAEGRLRATTDGAEAAREADVVVLIVPVGLTPESRPDYTFMDAAVASIGPGVHAGQTVIFETTLPVGDTRGRYAPRLAAGGPTAGGLVLDEELFVAFSPERLFSGASLANLAMYPKLVGGLGPRSTERAAAFYESVLDVEIVAMSSAEAAEMSKLAETTYRDVNIALANEFARYASAVGIDVLEVIAAANSQPYSQVHQPGIGVGGHCIPVYPNFLLARGPELSLVARAREINDGQLGVAVDSLAAHLGGLDGRSVLVLGLTYRAGVKELSFSQGPGLVRALADAGASVFAADPLLDEAEVRAVGAEPYAWGETLAVDAIVTQTADPTWRALDPSWFPGLRVVFDGRNSLRGLELPASVAYVGVGGPVGSGGEPGR